MQLWYPQSGPPAYHNDLSRPYKAFAWLKEEMAEIRRGIGKLLLHGDRDEGRVGIYMSQRTQFVMAALKEMQVKQAGATNDEAERKRLLLQFQDISHKVKSGLQRGFLDQQVECRFLSEYQVERGEIAEQEGKKLINEIKEKRKKKTDEAEDMASDRMREMMDKMDIPTKSDIDDLSAKIATLSKKVDELKKAQS